MGDFGSPSHSFYIMLTKETIEQEITGLQQKVEQLKQDIVLADGAIQAFKFVLDKMNEPQAEPEIMLEPVEVQCE